MTSSIKPECDHCVQSYIDPDNYWRCRITGKLIEQGVAENCRWFMRETGADDEPQNWCGRGD